MHAELSADHGPSSTMRIVVRNALHWNAVRVFSAVGDNAGDLCAEVRAWFTSNARCSVAEIVMVQSTGPTSHCISVAVFFRSVAADERR